MSYETSPIVELDDYSDDLEKLRRMDIFQIDDALLQEAFIIANPYSGQSREPQQLRNDLKNLLEVDDPPISHKMGEFIRSLLSFINKSRV